MATEATLGRLRYPCLVVGPEGNFPCRPLQVNLITASPVLCVTGTCPQLDFSCCIMVHWAHLPIIRAFCQHGSFWHIPYRAVDRNQGGSDGDKRDYYDVILPGYFEEEMSGTAADISLVHWRQQWLENGTLYFHVSMSSAGQLARATAPTLQEPSEIVEEQMHILHISVMKEEVTQTHTSLEFAVIQDAVGREVGAGRYHLDLLWPRTKVAQGYHLVVPVVLFCLQGFKIWIFLVLTLLTGDRVKSGKL
ncbi:hypothetical protein PANDA_019610 [Ailuropoda melanoleuca]|uniref:Astrotactin-1/2 N-terminal domain-containing protein n=1 Tax=Ailuropoda melanoleuca TaxID=9646 RepID=D2I2I4_AILME|nr:hypothetical protein PANDA_019610 [Ailuropoda melanoleuca]